MLRCIRGDQFLDFLLFFVLGFGHFVLPLRLQRNRSSNKSKSYLWSIAAKTKHSAPNQHCQLHLQVSLWSIGLAKIFCRFRHQYLVSGPLREILDPRARNTMGPNEKYFARLDPIKWKSFGEVTAYVSVFLPRYIEFSFALSVWCLVNSTMKPFGPLKLRGLVLRSLFFSPPPTFKGPV